jgi:hypothetical protein
MILSEHLLIAALQIVLSTPTLPPPFPFLSQLSPFQFAFDSLTAAERLRV